MRQASARPRVDPDVRRAKILEEAIGLIGQRGYRGFTVQELAQRCGLTNGGLLYHFGDKEQLLIAVIEEYDRREAAGVAAAAPGATREARSGASSRAAALEVLRTIVLRISRQPELARLFAVLQCESLDAAHPAHAYFTAREASTRAAFARMLASHSTEPESTARQVHAVMDGLALQWLRADLAFDLVAEWDRAAAKLLPGRDEIEPRIEGGADAAV